MMDPAVVVVDDERDVLELVRDVLEDEGLRVLALDSPEGALDISARVWPDVFLVDLMLPCMSGIELARRLRERGQTGAAMIAMSASRGMLSLARDSNLFDDVLPKPFDLDTLVECVERYLGEEQTA